MLDGGRIVERGTFRELVANKGLFARLVAEGGFTEPETASPMAGPKWRCPYVIPEARRSR